MKLIYLISTANAADLMVISGATSNEELCYVAEDGQTAKGTNIVLQSCARAIAINDGRDVFKYENGKLQSVQSKLCITNDNSYAKLGDCTSTQFQLQNDGTLKFGENLCLQQSGKSVGDQDVVFQRSGSATSSTHSHDVSKAVDGIEGNYWASAKNPKTVTLKFSTENKYLKKIDLDFAFPASKFSVQIKTPKGYQTCFATDSNNLQKLTINCGVQGDGVRIVLEKPHAILAKYDSNYYYGISNLKVYASASSSIFSSCEAAKKKKNGSGKIYFSEVTQFNGRLSQELKGAVDSLFESKQKLQAKLMSKTSFLEFKQNEIESSVIYGKKLFTNPDTEDLSELIKTTLIPEEYGYANIDRVLSLALKVSS